MLNGYMAECLKEFNLVDVRHIMNKMEDIFNYNHKSQSDEVLSDDYQLMLAYYSKLVEDPDKIKFTKKQIRETLKPIMLEMANRKMMFDTSEYESSATNIFEEVAEEIGLSATLIEKGIKTPFGHPAGKKYLRKEIIPILPEGKRYVESFCGGASIFFGIEHGIYEEEIINDLEKEYVIAFKFFKSMTEDDLNKLKQYNWTSSKSFFNELKGKQFKSNIEKVGRFLYLSWNSFNRMRKNYSPILGDSIKRLERIYAQVKPRLKGITILNKDALEVIKQYDSVDTIHYIDPPYPGKWDSGFGKDEFDVEELAQVLKNLKGKFLLSLEYDKQYYDLFKQFNIVKVNIRASGNTWVGEDRQKENAELLIANYELPRGAIVSRARHRRDKCMRCDEPPIYETLWADGRAHAWHCEKCFWKWQKGEHHRKNWSDFDAVKEVNNGEVGKKWSDNTNPDIINRLKSEQLSKISQQERLEQLEETEGSWYLVEENGKKHPFVIQYHVRGIWHSTKQIKPMFQALKKDDLALAKKHLADYSEELHPESKVKAKLDKALEEDNLDTFYGKVFKALEAVIIEKPLDELAKIMQPVDDKRGDVSGTLRKYVKGLPIHLDKLNLDHLFNIGNIHIDFRIKHPEEDYLVGLTHDVVKIALQDLDDNIHYLLRDRLLDNHADDNWLGQRKLTQPTGWLRVVTPEKPVWTVPPKKTGATIETAGRYFFKGNGYGYFGCMKSDFYEFWLFFNQNKYKHLNGRFDFKLIPSSAKYTKVPEKQFWMANRPPKAQIPYITTHDKEKEEAKAKEDKISLVWNEALLDTLEIKQLLSEESNKKALSGTITKVKKYKQVIITPVLIPDEADYAGDGISIEEVEKTAYDYMINGRKIGLMHKGRPIDASIVESRLLRRDEIEDGVRTPKGSWEAGIKINNKKVWKMILDGTLKGVSIQGYGFRRQV